MKYNHEVVDLWPNGTVIKYDKFCSDFEESVDTDSFGEWMERYLPDRKTRYINITESTDGPKWIVKIFNKINDKYGNCWLEIYY